MKIACWLVVRIFDHQRIAVHQRHDRAPIVKRAAELVREGRREMRVLDEAKPAVHERNSEGRRSFRLIETTKNLRTRQVHRARNAVYHALTPLIHEGQVCHRKAAAVVYRGLNDTLSLQSPQGRSKTVIGLVDNAVCTATSRYCSRHLRAPGTEA
jgi:hypothetical protein